MTSSGRVLHTVNPRLFPEQLQYIMHHAEDAFVFFDPVFAPLVEALAPSLPLVRGWVALCERDALPKMKLDGLLSYEDLLAKASPDYEWPVFDENTASTLCYTSGTTGNPKGVLVLASLDGAARFRRLRGRRDCSEGAGLDSRRGAALSRQRLESAVLRGDVRRETRAARPEARSREPL